MVGVVRENGSLTCSMLCQQNFSERKFIPRAPTSLELAKALQETLDYDPAWRQGTHLGWLLELIRDSVL